MVNQPSIKLSFSFWFQLRYCLVIVGLFVLASGLLYLFLDQSLGGSYLESLRTLYYLDQHLPFYLSIMALLLILFILVLTLVITLLVSHQIAGPVFRYESVLQQIAEGEYPDHVATRATDQMKPLVGSLNRLSGYYRDTFVAARDLSVLLEEELSEEAVGFEQLSEKVESVRERMTLQQDTENLP